MCCECEQQVQQNLVRLCSILKLFSIVTQRFIKFKKSNNFVYALFHFKGTEIFTNCWLFRLFNMNMNHVLYLTLNHYFNAVHGHCVGLCR